jgi:hypothetical protein
VGTPSPLGESQWYPHRPTANDVDQGVRMFRSRAVRRPAVLLATGALVALAVTACGGGGGSASSAGSGSAQSGANYSVGQDSSAKRAAGGEESASQAPAGQASQAQGGQAQGGQAQVSRAQLQATQQQLARRASIAIQVKDIRQAVARVRSTTAAAGGIVLSENIGSSAGGTPIEQGAQVTATTYGEMTVSVPQDQLDDVLDQLAGLGVVIRSQSSSEDVGAQIVDTQARLKTMQASVDRVRALMTQATDLTQVVALESELSRRQADLEALESQLAALKGSVAMSPVQVSLTTNPAVIATVDETGFLAGLRHGWDAFTASLVVVLTVVGAMLPFAVVLALVAVPLWWLLRRRVRRQREVAAATTAS